MYILPKVRFSLSLKSASHLTSKGRLTQATEKLDSTRDRQLSMIPTLTSNLMPFSLPRDRWDGRMHAKCCDPTMDTFFKHFPDAVSELVLGSATAYLSEYKIAHLSVTTTYHCCLVYHVSALEFTPCSQLEKCCTS